MPVTRGRGQEVQKRVGRTPPPSAFGTLARAQPGEPCGKRSAGRASTEQEGPGRAQRSEHARSHAAAIKPGEQPNPRGQLSGYGDAVQLFFDGDGVETERHFNTGVVQKYGYDLDRRLDELVATAADGSPIENLKWDFDPAGNLRSIADLRPSVSPADDRSESYTYDNLYRLRTAQGSWGHSEWNYSLSGNLVSRTSSVAPSVPAWVRQQVLGQLV